MADLVSEVVEGVRTCVCQTLATLRPDPDPCGAPCSCLVVAAADGQVAFDSCQQGQAWIRLSGAWPTNDFPNPLRGPVHCGSTWAVEIEVGVTRCACLPDEVGNPPLPACEESTARCVSDDAMRVRDALSCCVPLLAHVGEVVIGVMSPYGPSGGCVGTVVRVQIEIVEE
jgi:hypothetical protein